jgi:hypothetical protein
MEMEKTKPGDHMSIAKWGCVEKRVQEVTKRRRKTGSLEWDHLLHSPRAHAHITNTVAKHKSDPSRHPSLARLLCEEMLVD